MATLVDRVILFGGADNGFPGQNDRHFLADSWAWDGVTWKQLEPSDSGPSPRGDRAMATLGRKIVLYGGLVDHWEWDWDSATPYWASVVEPSSPHPSARGGFAMATLGSKLVLFGGRMADAPLHDTWEWDGTTWTQLAPLTYPTARSGHVMVTLNDKIVLFGGSGNRDTWLLGTP